jgi:hypothetical protein
MVALAQPVEDVVLSAWCEECLMRSGFRLGLLVILSTSTLVIFGAGCGKVSPSGRPKATIGGGTGAVVNTQINYQPGTPMVMSWDTASAILGSFEIDACTDADAQSCFLYIYLNCSGTSCVVSDVDGLTRSDVSLIIINTASGGRSYRLEDREYTTLGDGMHPVIRNR